MIDDLAVAMNPEHVEDQMLIGRIVGEVDVAMVTDGFVREKASRIMVVDCLATCILLRFDQHVLNASQSTAFILGGLCGNEVTWELTHPVCSRTFHHFLRRCRCNRCILPAGR